MNAPAEQHGPSNAVLAVELRHVREMLDRILVFSERSASKEEMVKADDLADRRLTSLEGAVRLLEAANTSTTAVVNLAKWVISIGGITLLGGALKWWLTSG